MYAVRLSIPPNTLVSDPEQADIDISPGIIRRVRVVMPSGCVDLVGVWITYRSSRIFPLNDSGYFLGNGDAIEFTPSLPVFEPPFVLTVNGYNSDDTYTHNPAVYFEIEHLGSYAAKQAALLAFLSDSFIVRTVE